MCVALVSYSSNCCYIFVCYLTVSYPVLFHILYKYYIELYEACHPPVLIDKTLVCMFTSFGYIELYEACHLPVLMDKIFY